MYTLSFCTLRRPLIQFNRSWFVFKRTNTITLFDFPWHFQNHYTKSNSHKKYKQYYYFKINISLIIRFNSISTFRERIDNLGAKWRIALIILSSQFHLLLQWECEELLAFSKNLLEQLLLHPMIYQVEETMFNTCLLIGWSRW